MFQVRLMKNPVNEIMVLQILKGGLLVFKPINLFLPIRKNEVGVEGSQVNHCVDSRPVQPEQPSEMYISFHRGVDLVGIVLVGVPAPLHQ